MIFQPVVQESEPGWEMLDSGEGAVSRLNFSPFYLLFYIQTLSILNVQVGGEEAGGSGGGAVGGAAGGGSGAGAEAEVAREVIF